MTNASAWKKLALIPLGILLGVFLLEAGLWIGAWYVQRTTGGELGSGWATGDLRVLTLGDSVTYGLFVLREESYPGQLETVWNETVDTPKFEVLNLGFPGTNSSRLVRDLPELLEALAPDLAIIMVGVNDFWTLPYSVDEEVDPRPRKGFLARHSRLFRLYYLIRRGVLGQQIEVVIDEEGTLETGAANKLRIGDKEFDMGFRPGRPSVGGDKRALRQNLIKLVEQAEEARVRLYLMRYPARHKFYKLVNPVIEAVARSTKTPLIDLTEVFKPLCPRVDCPEYYLSDNHHPNSLGNRTIAEAIVEELAPRSK